MQFDYDVLAKQSVQDENTSLKQTILSSNASVLGNQSILSSKNQNPFSINQNLSAYFTQSDKNIFAFEMQHLFQNEDPFYTANLQNQPFNFNGYVLGENRNRINQDRFVKTNKIDAKLDYYYMVTPKSNINVTLGITNSVQNFNSSIFQVLDNGIVNKITAIENNNDVKYQFNDIFLGLHYRLLFGKLTVNPGFSVHQYNTFNDQLNTRVRDDFYRILPDINVLYQIKKCSSIIKIGYWQISLINMSN